MFIVGVSGYAKVVLEIARSAGSAVEGFIGNDASAREFAGLPVRTEGEMLARAAGEMIVANDNPASRMSVTRRFAEHGWRFATLVHPRATVSPGAHLGAGAVVLAGAVIQPGARVGEGAIVNANAVLGHDVDLGDFAHAGPGAVLGGAARIGVGTWIGANASVMEGVSVGDWTMVGAGAVVAHELPDEVVAFGVPAQVRRRERYFPAESAPVSAAVDHGAAGVRETVADVINTILRDSGRDARSFDSQDQLMGNIGLDSLDLAVMTVSLEQRIGLDPFRSGRGAVRSFGELVAVYEESLRDAGK